MKSLIILSFIALTLPSDRANPSRRSRFYRQPEQFSYERSRQLHDVQQKRHAILRADDNGHSCVASDISVRHRISNSLDFNSWWDISATKLNDCEYHSNTRQHYIWEGICARILGHRGRWNPIDLAH